MELNEISNIFQEKIDNNESFLSKYAIKQIDSKRKNKECEEKKSYRSAYQIDRDRIIHTNSFRRLKHKSQVFVAPKGDHYTTRLTHVIEVSQIGRTIARALNLNEDMVEAASLGHDLGHTPFGHIGESALNDLLQSGFHHSKHSVRIIEVLEKDGVGLNLTLDVIEAIRMHSKPQGNFLTRESVMGMSLEAQVVRISDALAYLSHDIEDAFRSDFLSIKKIPNNIAEFINLPLSKRINILVSDLVKNSWDCTGFDHTTRIPIIKMSNDISNLVTELRNYMFENFYLPVSNSEQGKTAYRIVRLLFDFYLDNEKFIPKTYYKAGQNIERAVTDYICGMTDNFAIEEARKISPEITKKLYGNLI